MTDPRGPNFSVVVPTFQRNDLLARCLECLAPVSQIDGSVVIPGIVSSGCISNELSPVPSEESACSRFLYEVIVCDDGRTTTSEAMILERYPWVSWVAGPGTGPAANRNAGAAVAKGDWLVFTDDDCLPHAGWLKAFSNAFTATPCNVVLEGKTVPDRPRLTLAEHAPVCIQGGNLWSCNFAIQRSFFLELGGFDSQFRVCLEDSDFALRVREAGKTYPFLEEALVVHPWRLRKHFSDGWKSSAAEIQDHLRFKLKYPSA